ncbi:hypothetical protein AAVH_30317 [Aphelenchoides avenae]|nr:hypothetical protein AAVH_30317 [Aphelenchus avenae]
MMGNEEIDDLLGAGHEDGGTAKQMTQLQLNAAGTKPMDGVAQSVDALTTGSFVFNVPIGDKQWTSATREVVIIGQKSGMGLGIFDECNGTCSADCVGVTPADIAPDGLSN